MEYNRLYRSNTTKVIGGVAGGLAEHFGTDPAPDQDFICFSRCFWWRRIINLYHFMDCYPIKPRYCYE